MKQTKENTARVLALGLAFFGMLAVLGWVEGVFARLGFEIVAALAVFALAFAIASYLLDREVRAFVDSALRPTSAPGKSPGGKRAAT